MDLLIFITFLVLINIIVVKYTSKTRMMLVTSGFVIMFFLAPITWFITLISLGMTGSGIAGSVAGMMFGFITFINGIYYLFRGMLTSQQTENT
ncbi:putative membrane protein [Alkalibacillus filiformis]|uniref:Membrane protein n=1 Tax=Alkalibacillus filiformis TaxID=200990 RepID=A0ABU0DPL0_9BACI|nr:hypothetical protein [Alkalibacillus filiformis]MDQ0350300.1 putative membrane protein [Alkalibacillus filiformis]